MVAFDRFLARLLHHEPDHWVVKGGLALQLRLKIRARTTKDMDVSLIVNDQLVYPALKTAGALDLGDWFSFLVAQASRQTPAEFGATRHQIQTLLDGRNFESFHIDVGIGDPMIEPVDYITTLPMLEFAAIEPTRVPCFPISQQIAEKLHAYTRPRSSGEPSRVKDFIDILLLAGLGEIQG
jgi:Nucleotidyl transferase AbiEii toxin, Type IV TA system